VDETRLRNQDARLVSGLITEMGITPVTEKGISTMFRT
jgi:hypothetical protein